VNNIKKHKDNLLQFVNLPKDYSKSVFFGYQKNTEDKVFSNIITRRINESEKYFNFNSFFILFIIFNIFLYRITEQNDLTIGISLVNKDDIKDLDNKPLNKFIIRSNLSKNPKFKKLSEDIKKNIIVINKDFQFFKKETKHCLVLSVAIDQKSENSSFSDFIIIIRRNFKSEIVLSCQYNTGLFNRSTIKNFLNIIETLTDNILRNPNQRIEDVEMVSKKDRDKLINKFNDTGAHYPKDKTIHKLFEKQVKKTPNKIAVKFNNKQLTYQELNNQANQLARLLIKRGVKKNTVVGIFINASLETVIINLAILKAGGICLPLAIDYPAKRIEYMLNDAKAKFIVSNAEIMQNYNIMSDIEFIKIDNIKFDLQIVNNPENINKSNDIAYIFYTSGSTGYPKGTLMHHRGKVNQLYYRIKTMQFTDKDILCVSLSMGWQPSLLQIFVPLLIGGKLIIYSEEIVQNPYNLFKSINTDKVTAIEIGVHQLLLYLQYIEKNKSKKLSLKNLKILWTAGEKDSFSLVSRFHQEYKHIQYVVAYGQTENSGMTMNYKLPYKFKATRIFEGTPGINTQVYILDKNMKLVPFGIVGDVYVSGDGLVGGYLNHPQKTKEVFLSHPFLKNKKIYKTGDIGKIYSNGNIKIVGRKDFQVKIRSSRVEIEEIENNLQRYKNIKVCAICVKQDKERENYIVAYYTSYNNKKIKTEILKNHLKQTLPDYMIPAYFICLKEMPLNQNGKLDKLNLPEPTEKDLDKKKYISPKTETEQQIAEIWKKVLNIKKIGVNDNFLDLGGNSLKAVQVLAEISNKFNIDLLLKDLFKYNTPRKLAVIINDQFQHDKKKNLKIDSIIKFNKNKKYYPLSYSQKRIFILYNLEPNSSFYNTTHLKEITGNLDIKKFKKALITTIKKHESFRTNFKNFNKEPIQIIHSSANIDIGFIDISKIPNLKGAKDKIIKKSLNIVFNLEKDPLIKNIIVRESKEKYSLITTVHHIIFDEWSLKLFYKDLATCYNAYLKNKKPDLLPLNISYKDYVAWELSQKDGQKFKDQEKYWLKELSGELSVIDLPVDFRRPTTHKYNGNLGVVDLNKSIIRSLNKIAIEQNTTIFVSLFTIFNLFLYRLTNQEDLIVGTSIINRGYNNNFKNIIGLFVNTLPIRIKIKKELKFNQLLKRTRNKFLDVYNNKDYPFERIVEKVNPERNISKNPIFNIFFELINFNNEKDLIRFDGLKTRSIIIDQKKVKFDIRFRIIEKAKNNIVLVCDYNTDIFKKETIKNYLNIFKELLKNIVNNPEQKIKDTRLLTKKEEKEIFDKLTNKEVTDDRCLVIQDRLMVSFRENKERIAIEYGDYGIKYKELNNRANKILNRLLKIKLKRQWNVALLVADKIDLISSIIGVLKSRNVFVPLDVDDPIKRIETMLKEACIKYIITDKKEIKNRFKNKYKIIFISDVYQEKMINTIGLPKCKPEDGIYIYFTSGSTGKPKAILGQNKSLTHFIDWEIKELKADKSIKVSQLTSISFDASLRDFFVPLLSGGTICIPQSRLEILTQNKLSEWIKDKKVNILHATPSVFKLIEAKNEFKDLEYVILAGEKLSPIDIKDWKDKKTKIINMYGPSETTMVKTYHIIKKEDFDDKFIPIGKPINDTQLLILDKNKNTCPPGVIGELYINTTYSTKGYYRNSVLNRKQFIKNPLNKNSRNLIYKTGDLVKMNLNGNIEVVGRRDNQIKIRGIRIELGEVEVGLKSIKNIKDAVVIQYKDNLAAYYITRNKKKIKESEIKEKLKEVLPEYMIPKIFVNLQKMPLSYNGKLERLNLPKLKASDLIENKYFLPKTETEKQLICIWKKILNIKKIGLNDNFFDLGGHSIKAIQATTMINKKFKIDLSLKIFFQCSTIAKLAQKIEDIIIGIKLYR